MLCDLLAATGCAGVPNSHFHRPDCGAWLKSFGLSRDDFTTETDALAAVFRAAIIRGTGSTGLFGLRLQRDSFGFFMDKLSRLHPGLPDDRARIEAAFGRTHFLHLSRNDKLDQAISLVMARQTGLWHRATDGSERERLAPPDAPRFDADLIGAAHDDLRGQDNCWVSWFRAQNIAPMTISYDALATDPQGELAKVLSCLGRDPARAAHARPGVAKLADATNRDWKRRYLALRGN